MCGFSQGRLIRELLPPLKCAGMRLEFDRIFGGRTRERDLGRNVSARQADCPVRLEAVGLCGAGGRFSRISAAAIAGSSSGPSLFGCSWRPFHDVAFYCRDLSPTRMCQGRQGRPEREGFTRDRENTCGGQSTVLCGTARSAARMDDLVASVSAQAVLGGVLGGNLAFYTITSRTGL